jgi:MYXO-CTERM domain-containing protein
MKRSTMIAALVAVGGTAAAAMAQTQLAEFQYEALGSTYTASSATTGTFTASAVNLAALQTEGRVSRTIATEGTAAFEPGFVGANPFAGFNITLSVNKTSATDGTGSGTFTVTDADGDTLTGSVVNGIWNLVNTLPGGPFVAFSGDLVGVSFTDNGAADGLFNGTDALNSDNFNFTNFPAIPPFSGAVIALSFDIDTFFDTNISLNDAVSSQVSADIVPTPGALALLGLGGLAAVRRRR